MDKFFLWYLRSILKVKTTTANNIVWGETGCTPLSVSCNVKVFCYYNRLRNLPDTMLVKRAFIQLYALQEQGFQTWVGKVWELAHKSNFNLHDVNRENFKKICKEHMHDQFVQNWKSQIHNLAINPILRTYTTFKADFLLETFLDTVNDTRYRIAISRFRASSHSLEIERGRYNNINRHDRSTDSYMIRDISIYIF